MPSPVSLYDTEGEQNIEISVEQIEAGLGLICGAQHDETIVALWCLLEIHRSILLLGGNDRCLKHGWIRALPCVVLISDRSRSRCEAPVLLPGLVKQIVEQA